MSRLRMLGLSLVVALAGVALVAAPATAASTLSGVVRDGNGVPIANMIVDLHQASDGQSLGYVYTGTDGSYSIQAPVGTPVAVTLTDTRFATSLNAGTATFTLAGDQHLDFAFPQSGTLHASVVTSDSAAPVVGARVLPVLTGATGTSNGVTVYYGVDANGCSTGNDGTCNVQVFRGGSIDHVLVTPFASGPAQTFPGFATPTATTEHTFAVASSYPVSGVLTGGDGTPLSGAVVAVLNGSTTLASTVTGADGSYLLAVAPGSVRLTVNGTVVHDGQRVPYALETGYFDVNRPRQFSTAFPLVSTVKVWVLDSLEQPVPGASVTFDSPASTVSGATDDGIPVTIRLYPSGAGPSCSQTTSAGLCEIPGFAGGVIGGFEVAAPFDRIRFFPGPNAPNGYPPSFLAQLMGYASVPSAGSNEGRVVVTTSDGDTFAALSATPKSFPEAITSVIGQMDYRVHVQAPGGSTRLSLRLPDGAQPNAVFRAGTDGSLSDITSDAQLNGNTVGVWVTDGGPGDADGVVNGYVSGNLIPVVRDPLRVQTAELPAVVKGRAYSYALSASGSGSPYTWSLASGALPPGISLSSDGLISGTPTQLGTYQFAVQVRDSYGATASRYLSLTVSTIAVVTTSVPDAYLGGSYSVALKYAGGSIPYWRLDQGSLPPGIKLSSNGTLSGTPTTAGTYRFRVTVSSGSTTSPPSLELTIVVHPMEIATSALPDAPIAASYSQKLSANGGKGTLSWSLGGGALPPGLTLSSSGTLSGKPSAVGTYQFTIKVTDQSSPQQVATRTFTLVVTPMQVAANSVPDAKKGQYYSTQLVASGGKPTLAWSVVGGSLPTGLSLSSSGKITGYPKAVGSWTFTVRVADASTPQNTATATLTLTVT